MAFWRSRKDKPAPEPEDDDEEAQVKKLGYSVNDVLCFLEAVEPADYTWELEDFLVSKSLRQEYEAWRDGKITLFGCVMSK